VHFKALGHPIVCDKFYGFKKPICSFGLSRHFLHANSLELNLPSGSRIKLEADLPDDLQNALNMLNY
jgi:23S rRNA-/tRNA-specific pseudouridylate synthase